MIVGVCAIAPFCNGPSAATVSARWARDDPERWPEAALHGGAHPRLPLSRGGGPALRLAFLTSTPMSVSGGSGTFVGISVLQEALASRGCRVERVAPATGRPPL